MRREEALATPEDKVRISEKALSMVTADLDTKWAKAEATRKEYLDKIDSHTGYAKHSLGLDNMLGEKNVLLNRREQDLSFARWHWWRHRPEDSTPSTTVRS
jgi:hypothetical protein